MNTFPAIRVKSQNVRQIDIARTLGLSRSAVARVLAQPEDAEGRKRLNAETERLIRETAEKMGYKPSFIGRSLRHNKSFLVGLLNLAVNSDLHKELNVGIQEMLDAHDYAPIVFTHEDLASEKKYLQSCLNRQVEGLLVNCVVDPDGKTDAAQFGKVNRSGIPVVELFGRFVPEVPSVIVDFRAAGDMAVERLLRMGHKRIALFIHDQSIKGTTIRSNWTGNELWKGYCAAMQKRGLEPLVIPFDLREGWHGFQGLVDAMAAESRKAIRHPAQPTAFVARYREGALSLLDQAEKIDPVRRKNMHAICIGVRGVIPYSASNFMILEVPARKIGQAAARLLVEMIREPNLGAKRSHYPDILIPPED